MSKEQNCEALFATLENRLSALEPKDPTRLGRDRWVVGAVLVGGAMTAPSLLGAGYDWIGWLTLAGLVLELCGLGVLIYRQVRDAVPEFLDAERKFASELDTAFVEYERLLDWLRELPSSQRERRLAYLDSRLDSMATRYPIVFGAVDKLGLLPLLFGVFLQVQAITTVSFVTGLLAFFILLLYGSALWMTRYRLQVLSYARLLRAAKTDSAASGS